MERSFVPVCIKKLYIVLISIGSLLAAVLAVSGQIWDDFTVWYDGNGADSGHITEERYKSGSNDVTLKNNESSSDGRDVRFTRRGCTFLGWSLSAENGSVITPILPGGTVWDPIDVPVTWNEDKAGFVFYARWDCDPSVQPVKPTSTPAPEKTEQASQTPTADPGPVLLIAPEGRSSAKGSAAKAVNGSTGKKDNTLLIAPIEHTSAGTMSGPLPVLFSSSGDDLMPLPATGITSRTGFPRSQKPASVKYSPTLMELQIPSLDIRSEILFVESDETGYPVQWLEMDTGLLADTALPGEGFSVLAAHNTLDAVTYGPFALIGSLRSGDRFFIRTHDNSLMAFEVYSNEKISEYDYEELYQAGSQYDITVTLLTCEDERAEGGYASRRIVSAKMIQL